MFFSYWLAIIGMALVRRLAQRVCTYLKIIKELALVRKPAPWKLHYFNNARACKNGKGYKFCILILLFFFNFLKCDGVNPVTFLNCADKWATLL